MGKKARLFELTDTNKKRLDGATHEDREPRGQRLILSWKLASQSEKFELEQIISSNPNYSTLDVKENHTAFRVFATDTLGQAISNFKRKLKSNIKQYIDSEPSSNRSLSMRFSSYCFIHSYDFFFK